MNRLRCQFVFCISIVAFVIFIYSPCLATTIVSIQTSDVIVIASDSEGTLNNSLTSIPIRCTVPRKIFQEGDKLYAISGLYEDPNRKYYPKVIISSYLQEHPSPSTSIEVLETDLSKAVKEVWMKIRDEEPFYFRDSIENNTAGTDFLLAYFEKEKPVVITRVFHVVIEPDGKLEITIRRRACPGDCPSPNNYFLLGRQEVIKEYLVDHSEALSKSIEDTARFWVQLEINAKTPGVGPPVIAVRMDKNGIEWLSAQEKSE